MPRWLDRAANVALLLSLALGASQCRFGDLTTIETLQQVLTTSIVATFESTSGPEAFHDISSVQLEEALGLGDILGDADSRPEEILSISVAGAQYRVLNAETCPCLRIEDGHVTIRRGSEPPVDLVADFATDARFATEKTTLLLEESGVALLNQILEEALAALQAGTSIDETLAFEIHGLSTPGCTPCSFAWELTVIVTLIVETEVELPNL